MESLLTRADVAVGRVSRGVHVHGTCARLQLRSTGIRARPQRKGTSRSFIQERRFTRQPSNETFTVRAVLSETKKSSTRDNSDASGDMAHPELKSRPSAEDAALLGSSALSLREKEDLLFRLPLEIGLTAEDLASTDQHRLIVGVASALLVALLGKGLLACHGTPDTIEVTIAAALAYILSDLGSGVYHWAIDNYGDANTPIFGQQIAGFQGHHEFPWTITMRGFANNVHKTFAPTIPFALLYLATSESASWDVFAATFMFFVAASQQLHSWSHMKRSELPATVIALQEAGLLISRKAHGAHHLPPFEDNYCIVSGVWNPWLDRSGVFRVLERAVYAVTGVRPRCWEEGGKAVPK